MGSIVNRGSAKKPNWYCKYKSEAGKWTQMPTKQPTRELAEKFCADLEARIARSVAGLTPRPGLTPGSPKPVRSLRADLLDALESPRGQRILGAALLAALREFFRAEDV